MAEDLKVAVIGAGSHAQSHFGMIAAEPAMRLVGVAELDPERLARANADHGPEVASTDYHEMLDRARPDVVYVETLPGHLLPIVLDCIERDIHTSVEKSPGMNSGETAQMLAAARRSSAKVIVSFNRRYFPQVLAVKQLVLARGGAVHCAATYNKPFWDWANIPGGAIPAPIIGDAIHLVDLLRWLAGDDMERAADVATVYGERWESRPGTDRHNAVITFANGRCAVMMSHYGVGFRIQRSEVHAEDFSAYLDTTIAPTRRPTAGVHPVCGRRTLRAAVGPRCRRRSRLQRDAAPGRVHRAGSPAMEPPGRCPGDDAALRGDCGGSQGPPARGSRVGAHLTPSPLSI